MKLIFYYSHSFLDKFLEQSTPLLINTSETDSVNGKEISKNYLGNVNSICIQMFTLRKWLFWSTNVIYLTINVRDLKDDPYLLTGAKLCIKMQNVDFASWIGEVEEIVSESKSKNIKFKVKKLYTKV